MPLYEFHCEQCGDDVELFWTRSGQVMPVCPSCKQPMVRVISVPAIRGETVAKS